MANFFSAKCVHINGVAINFSEESRGRLGRRSITGSVEGAAAPRMPEKIQKNENLSLKMEKLKTSDKIPILRALSIYEKNFEKNEN